MPQELDQLTQLVGGALRAGYIGKRRVGIARSLAYAALHQTLRAQTHKQEENQTENECDLNRDHDPAGERGNGVRIVQLDGYAATLRAIYQGLDLDDRIGCREMRAGGRTRLPASGDADAGLDRD